MSKEYKIDWVDWKNHGGQFDDNDICPFCANQLDGSYSDEKKLFQESYTKSGVSSIIEMLKYFNALKDYMNDEKSNNLDNFIKHNNGDIKVAELHLKNFCIEIQFLISELEDIFNFNSFNASGLDISKLDEELKKLKIDISSLNIFTSEKTISIIDIVNNKIEKLLKEINELKKSIGTLKGYINDNTEEKIKDINQFLSMSGINYELGMEHSGENEMQSVLKYRPDKNIDAVDVPDIKKHLSWGERNAFALVLFMHYALSENTDLIILDDPISSFDSNKKYAIIHRLFSSKNNTSFFRKTLLMLTHDFQSIIDFISVGKPIENPVLACYMRNNNGIIEIKEIKKENIIALTILLAENASNDKLNPIHRIACLRKLTEYSYSKEACVENAYNILSSLAHGK